MSDSSRLRPALLTVFVLLALLASACGEEDAPVEPRSEARPAATFTTAPGEEAAAEPEAAKAPAEEEAAPAPAEEDGPLHIHGLGVNPANRDLFIATHTGLWRAPAGERKATRVGDDYKDVMGFTVVGPNRFLGSGHPDAREELPPLLGLISSEDAGETWAPVSLLGEADFHVLRAVGETIYGLDASNARLMVSRDGGKSWKERKPPVQTLDLAVHPDRPGRIIASGVRVAFESRDYGKTWKPRAYMPAGQIAWTSSRSVTVVDVSGAAWHSRNGGRKFKQTGAIGGEPAAVAVDGRSVLVALHDGSVKRSTDGGRSWKVVVAASA